MKRTLAAAFSLLIYTFVIVALDAPARADTIVNKDANGNQATRFDVDGNGIDAHDGSVIQAADGGTCAFSGTTQTVAYGAAGRFVYKAFTNGTTCNPAAFGRDPIFGVAKRCYLAP